MKDSDQILTRYLLGESSETEAHELEQKYFADPQLFSRLLETENQLVDDYARGRLPAALRDRFQNSYLANPERRERVQFAQAFAARLDQSQETVPSPVRAESWWNRLTAVTWSPKLSWAFAVAFVLIAAAGVWLVIQTRRLQQELAR